MVLNRMGGRGRRMCSVNGEIRGLNEEPFLSEYKIIISRQLIEVSSGAGFGTSNQRRATQVGGRARLNIKACDTIKNPINATPHLQCHSPIPGIRIIYFFSSLWNVVMAPSGHSYVNSFNSPSRLNERWRIKLCCMRQATCYCIPLTHFIIFQNVFYDGFVIILLTLQTHRRFTYYIFNHHTFHILFGAWAPATSTTTTLQYSA